MTYDDLISQFFYEAAPHLPATPEVRFEAVMKEVFGTKQRRNGPMPSPEQQVKIRDVVRNSDTVHFFVAWAARKQVDGMGLDVLEFCALRQLRDLQRSLRQLGKDSKFTFRVDDHTDRYLFGTTSEEQIQWYVQNLRHAAAVLLDDAELKLESDCTPWGTFNRDALKFTHTFYDYLTGKANVSSLQAVGWKGEIPDVQREYYENVYRVFYPHRDTLWEMSRYFAATLTRNRQGAAHTPEEPFVTINFYNPVPGNPVERPRVFYRSIPERNSHTHRAPWTSKGYFVVDGNNGVCPKSAGVHDHRSLPLVKHSVRVGDASVEADYLLEE